MIETICGIVRSAGASQEQSQGGSIVNRMVAFEAIEITEESGQVTVIEGAVCYGQVASAIEAGGPLELLVTRDILSAKAMPWGGTKTALVYMARKERSSHWLGERDLEHFARIHGDLFVTALWGYPLALVTLCTVVLSPFGLRMLWELHKARRMRKMIPSRDEINEAVSKVKRSCSESAHATMPVAVRA